MALKNVQVGPDGQTYDQSNPHGMEDALDRMSQADVLAMTATVLSEIESKQYDVVGNLLAPSGMLDKDGNSSIPLATANYNFANDVKADITDTDTEPVRQAKATYQMLLRGDFFRDLDRFKTSAGKGLKDFDPILKLKENLLRMLINVYNAQAADGFDNLGNHPFTDVDGTTKIRDSIATRIGPILAKMVPNANAADIKDLVDLHSEIASEVLAAKTAHDIALGIVHGSRMDTGLINRYLLNHDPSVRKAFAGNAKGRQGAMDALGFIDFGSTGHTGRQGYESSKNAWMQLFVEEEKKLTGPKKFEDAAAGVMFHRVIDFLNAGGKPANERAQSLIEMFEQADKGLSDALTANRTIRIKNHSIKDVLTWPLNKLEDIKRDLTQETYELLSQRIVYQDLRNYWVPRLQTQIIENKQNIGDFMVEVEKDLSPQAKRWGSFIRDTMQHINNTLQLSALMNGIEPVANRSLTPFRWRVFEREYQETEQFPDYGDVLAIDKASYRQLPTRIPKPGEIHILDISGFTGPRQAIDDALRRIMMVDAYSTFKNFAGVSVTTDKNKRTLTEMGSLYHHGQRIHEEQDKKLAHAASARLASLGQDIIHKDIFSVTEKSLIMDGVQQIARHGAVKALLSVKQIYAQVLPGMVAYSYIREGRTANKDFPALFSKIVYSMTAGRIMDKSTKSSDLRILGDHVDYFTLINGPLVYRRTAGGEEEYHKAVSRIRPSAESRVSRTFGSDSRFKRFMLAGPNILKKGASVVVDASDKMLHFAIATPESAFARSIFAHQIWKMVNDSLPAGEKVSFDDLVDPIKGKAYNITPAMKKRAEVMVNDMIASTDRAKKAELLQQAEGATTELFRGLFATFANHPLHTWGNTRASMSMMKHGDEESKIDGRRLMASNIFQNVLFQLTRIEVAAQILGVAAPLIASLFSDLDEEDRDAMRKRIVGSIYGINEDGSLKDGLGAGMRYLTIALGSGKPLGYQEGEGWSEQKLSSDQANLAGRVLQEGLVQFVPGAATTLGSKGLEALMEAVVKKTIDPDGKRTFKRAGLVIGDGPQGNLAERSIYNSTQFYKNHLSDLSYFTIGLNSAVDPMMRISNAQGEVGLSGIGKAYASELPILTRDVRSYLEKETDKSMDVKKWASFWERKKKASYFGY
jgi:hypothetical protein